MIADLGRGRQGGLLHRRRGDHRACGRPRAQPRAQPRALSDRAHDLRELARRLGLSASLISQLESGQSRASVGTLYSIVTELGVSLDHVIRGADLPDPSDPSGARAASPVVHPGERATIDLDSGVRWEELAAAHERASTSSRPSTRSAAPPRPTSP